MIRLVDDQELSRLLRVSDEPAEGPVFTTGLWYLRLCQAVFASQSGRGELSRPLAQLAPVQRERAMQAILELPPKIGLVSLRALAPSMGHLRATFKLNLLASEVLAAALHLNAQVCLSAPSPRLEQALVETGCSVQQLYGPRT